MFEKLLSPSLSGYEALDRNQPGSSEDTAPRTVQDRQQAVCANKLDGRDKGQSGPRQGGVERLNCELIQLTGGDMSNEEAGTHRTMDSNLAGSAPENLSRLKLVDVEEEVSAPAAVFLLADPLEKSFSGDVEALIETAIPVKRWFRAIISLVQLVVGGICIQVGMREEDTVCQATFCSLLILSGVFQIVHSFVGMRFVIRRLGTEAEETRMILWCVEFILWLSVLHAVVTNSCENLKLQVR